VAQNQSDTSRKLNPDQLGKMAQAQFGADCIPASLIPNESNYDRTGWDYIVEWPHVMSTATLDNRPTPISCHVQTKAAWVGNDTIRLRLSSAERLAKELKPAFVYVYAVNDELKYEHPHVIHIQGEFLALILKKLRETEAAKKKANQIEFDVTVSKWGEPINVGGVAFRSFVESEVAGSMADYAARKQLELETLGYGPGRFTLTTTLFASHHDLVDAFLGLKPVEAELNDHVEERFGITLPVPEFDAGRSLIEFLPNLSDRCEIRMRKTRSKPLISFKGNVYRVPAALLDPKKMKMAIKTELLVLILTINSEEREKGKLEFQIAPRQEAIENERFKAADWNNFYNLFASLAEGTLTMEIVGRKSSMPTIRGTITRSERREEDARRWRRFATLVDNLEEVLRAAGAPNMKLRFEEILDAADDIEIAAALVTNPSILTAPIFKAKPAAGIKSEFTAPILYFRAFELGTHAIVFCAKLHVVASMIDNEIVCRGDKMEFVALERIRHATDAAGEASPELQDFLDQIRKETGIESYFLAQGQRSSSGIGDDTYPEFVLRGTDRP
jgi:hypothetical protein